MPTPDEPAEKTGKLSLFYKRHEMTITRAEVVIIFLALKNRPHHNRASGPPAQEAVTGKQSMAWPGSGSASGCSR
jgi:hypothetical protein